MKTKTEYVSTLAPASYTVQYFNWNASLQDWDPNPFIAIPCSGQKGLLRKNEITYDDAKRSGKLKVTRACDHVKTRFQVMPTSVEWYLSQARTQKGVVMNANDYYGEFGIPVPDLTSANAEALEFFKAGCIKQELELVNNLWEFKEVARLAEPLGAKVAKWSIKDPFDAHLWYAFGVKPLMQDMEALVKVIKGLSAHLAWLRKNHGKPVRVQFSKDLSTSILPANIINHWGSGQGETQYVYNTYRCFYRAYATVVYDLTGITDLEIQAKTLLHAFGVDKPFSVLWEAMPYSFVLDWFVKLGDWINRLQPAISFPMKFLDVGHSIKLDGFRRVYNKYYWPLKGYAQTHMSNEGYYHLYHRRPGLPTSFLSLDRGDPGITQLALGISLFMQKAR